MAQPQVIPLTRASRFASRLAGPHPRDLQAQRHQPGRLRPGYRARAAHLAVPGGQRDHRCGADQRGGRRRPRAGRHARRPTRRAADAKQRGRQLHQHVFAAAQLRHSLRHPGDDARRVRRFQSVAGADGLDHRADAQALRLSHLSGRARGGHRGRRRRRLQHGVRRRNLQVAILLSQRMVERNKTEGH